MFVLSNCSYNGDIITILYSLGVLHNGTIRPYLFDLTLLGPDRPHFGRLQIKMIVTSYVNAPHARAHSSAQISDFSMAVL